MIYSKQCFSVGHDKEHLSENPQTFIIEGKTPADIITQTIRFQAFTIATLFGNGDGLCLEIYRQIIKDVLSRDFEPPEM